MKKVIGVLIITSVITIGLYSYSRIGDKKEPEEETNFSPATVSDPLNGITTTEDESLNKPEENKPAPELDAFKGLEGESVNLFDAFDDLPQDVGSDPLKDIIQ